MHHEHTNGKNGHVTMKEQIEDLKDRLSEAGLKSRKSIDHFRDSAEEAFEEGAHTVKMKARQIDRKVRKNPWLYLGATAAAALAVGFIMASVSKKK